MDRGALNDVYANIPVYDSNQSVQDILSKLSQNFYASKPFDNEPGIKLAADYFNWLKNHESESRLAAAKLSATDRVHFVVLTDENNSESHLFRNAFTGAVTSSKPLYFYSDRENNLRLYAEKI